MKKCPVCGVMMGDNVARCFMCKYDFQKASREGEDVARKEAVENVKKGDLEVSARVAEKKAEEDRLLKEMKEKSRLELEAAQRQLEEEKLRLEQEYVEAKKRSLDERAKLEKDLALLRSEIDKEKMGLADTSSIRDAAEKAAIKDAEGAANQYLEEARREADMILKAANDETEALAIQVQKEYKDAMNKKQSMLDEATRMQDEVKAAQKKIEDLKSEYEQNLKIVSDAQAQAEIKAKEILDKASAEAAELARKAQMEHDAKLSEIEKSHESLTREAAVLRKEIETTRAEAQEELNGYLEQAKAAIAQTEESMKIRADIDQDIDKIRTQATAVRAEAEAMMKEADETKAKAEAELNKAREELALVERQTEEARNKAQQDAMVFVAEVDSTRSKAEEEVRIILAEVESTRTKAEEEVRVILAERDQIRAEAEAEAIQLREEIENAKKMIAESSADKKVAETEAAEIRKQTAEDIEIMILAAEKKAIAIKESAMSENERGRLAAGYEKQAGTLQKTIDSLEHKLKDKEASLAKKNEEVIRIMEELENAKKTSLQANLIPKSVPMEYEIEQIPHKLTGEVDTEAIAEVLLRRGPKGWKLHSLINDVGDKAGAAEKVSLSAPALVKEDRIIMIFERVIPAEFADSSSQG